MSSSHKRRARPASDLQLQSSGAYKLNLPWNQLELWHKGLSPESHSAAVNLAVFEHLKHFEAGLPHTQKQSICRSTDVYGVFRRDVLEVWHVPPTWRFFAQGLWMRLAFGVTDDEEEQDQCVVEHRLDLFPNEPQDPAVNSRKWTAQNGLLIAMILLHAPYLNMEGVAGVAASVTDATGDDEDLPHISYSGVGTWKSKESSKRGLLWKANIVVADFMAGSKL